MARLARAGGLVVLKLRKRERKIRFVHKRLRTVFPVYHGERLAPIALTREEPVAQLVLRLGASDALLLKPLDHRLAGRIHAHAVQESGVDHHARRDVRESFRARVRNAHRSRCIGRSKLRPSRIRLCDDLIDWQTEHLREIEVALVMRRHGHDCARAVRGKHVVRNEYGEPVSIHRVNSNDPIDPHTRLFLVELRALEVAFRGGLPLVRANIIGILHGAGRQPFRHKPVFGRQHHVCGSEKRVAARCEHRHDIASAAISLNLEIDERACRFPDPVALHLLDALRPVKAVKVGKQPLRIRSYPEHPLAHWTALNRMVPAFGTPVYDLLVRENRAKRGTPVHRHLRDIGESLPVELLEYPLRPPVVPGVGGVDLAVPIVRKAEHADLLAEAVYVLLRRDGGMGAGLHRVLLRRQAKRIPSHRMQHIETLHPLVAAQDVGCRVSLRMPHVQSCA